MAARPKKHAAFGWASDLRTFVRAHPNIEVVLTLIAFIALTAIIFILVVPLPSGTPPMRLTATTTPGTPDFLSGLSGLLGSPVKRGGTIRVLSNGDEFLPDLLASIASAKTSITFTNFIWYDGLFSSQVFDALIAAQKRGVAVRVLVDAEGAKLPKSRTDALKAIGGKVELFRPISLGSITRINKRNHRRAIVIDGTTGYLGGIAIADDWLGNGHTEGSWRDFMFKVHGTMAQSLQISFADIWYERIGEVLTGPAFYPPITDNGTIPYIALATSPTEFTQPIKQIYMYSIITAQKSLYIANPYFIPDDEMLQALIAAKERGVDVRILIPAPGRSPVHFASEVDYTPLLNAGIKIYEYPNLMHEKLLIEDSVWTIIGSANLDYRSRAINDENVMGVSDAAFAHTMETGFAADTSFAHEVTLEEWQKHAALMWIPAHFSELFEKQY